MQLSIMYQKPTINDKDILLDYIEEHRLNGEGQIEASCGLESMDFKQWLCQIQNMPDIETYLTDSDLYMICFNDRLVGLLNIRYNMVKMRGNVSVGIRPSERQMGFATEALKFAVQECKKRGLERLYCNFQHGEVKNPFVQ